MLLLYALLFLPVLAAAQESQTMKMLDQEILRTDDTKGASNWIREGCLDTLDTVLPISKPCGSIEERKKKHKLNKYVLPLIVGFLLIKSILLPIALKALAVLSGKAVVLSLMSLILAAIVGLKKVAQKENNYEVVNKHRRQDVFDFVNDLQELEPYRLYKQRRRRK